LDLSGCEIHQPEQEHVPTPVGVRHLVLRAIGLDDEEWEALLEVVDLPPLSLIPGRSEKEALPEVGAEDGMKQSGDALGVEEGLWRQLRGRRGFVPKSAGIARTRCQARRRLFVTSLLIAIAEV